MTDETPLAPVPPDEVDRPAIGVDEWVASAEERMSDGEASVG